ncbi:MAG: T9SS type A sorting domain-containing protein [Candidatus Eisenbacteria bacterium]|nr:T9SS type A sorting domain-containing protein [Candidatus Eisenbacteria bacterium]
MRTSRIAGSILAALMLAAGVASATPVGKMQTIRRPRPALAEVIDNAQLIDINSISMFVTNTGSFAWNKATQVAGLEFPKGTGKTAVYAAGLWLGGVCRDSAGVPVLDTLRVAVSEYSDEYGPGAMVGGVSDDPTKAEYKVYKLDRVYTDSAVRDAALADYNAGAVPHGAPVVTVQGDGSLNILGDEMCWAVYNDADAANHSNRAGKTNPLGLEVQQTTFAFSRQGALGNTVFIKYRIINKGVRHLDNMFVSQWSDPDLGGATDDLVGCNVGRSLGFVYNATNNDALYGGQPPSVGFDFFQGPRVGGTPLPMASFNAYFNGNDPDNFRKTYNFMKGLDATGNPVTNPKTGLVDHFTFDGDPVSSTGWLDVSPNDKRLMLSAGPFAMAPGDTQEVVAGIVIGQSANRLASIALMQFYDDLAQSAFDLNFVLPSPPNSPTAVATPQDGAVQLTWDNKAESYNGAPYAFEGYVVYQGASIAGPFTRIATYDVVDGIQTVLDDAFDDQSFVVLKKPSALGTDAGVRYQARLTTDAVHGGPLFSGTKYYYVVTAYAVALGQTPQVLESPLNVFSVVPQGPAAGVDWSTASVTAPSQGAHAAGPAPTTDNCAVSIVDPNQLIKADYLMGYKPNAAGTMTWYVVRTVGAAVDTIINNQLDFTGDNGYPVFDGLQLKVSGAPLGLLGRVSFVPATAGTPPPFAGQDVGGLYFGGSADYSAILLPVGSQIDPTDPSKSFDVEVDFTGPLGVNQTVGQNAYHYFRTQDAGGGRVYQYQDYINVPFTVWDVSGAVPRQLNVGFLENQGNPVTAPATNHDYTDNRWDPDDLPDFNGFPGDDRQFLDIFSDSYSGASADPAYAGDWLSIGATQNGLYGFWPVTTDSINAPVHVGDKVVFATSKRGPNDYFTFSSTPANRFNAALAKNELALVKAVPNPYFAHSSYELNQFIRVLKFTHLPAQCTIRLFNLAGELVRTITKNDASSEAIWDLQSSRGLPVGSGIYVFHVDAPNVGTKIGKVVVFMEKERLNNF